MITITNKRGIRLRFKEGEEKKGGSEGRVEKAVVFDGIVSEGKIVGRWLRIPA